MNMEGRKREEVLNQLLQMRPTMLFLRIGTIQKLPMEVAFSISLQRKFLSSTSHFSLSFYFN